MYGNELKYGQCSNRKGKLVYALYGETHPGHLIRYFVNRRYMNRYSRSGNANVLEIGSANGAFAFWLSRNGNYSVDAIELDSTLVRNCEAVGKKIKRENLCFICADASKELALDEKYDIIFSSHVLEHIHDDEAVLINAYRYLRPGGFLLLQVPYGNPFKMPSKEDLRNGHVREGYNEEDIRKKLVITGFEIVSATGGVGRLGRFAYQFAKKTTKLFHRFHGAIMFFPITLFFIYLEQIAALLRMHEPSFIHWPVILARRPA